MDIKLYEFAPTRSARVRWTLQELDLPFSSVSGREVFGSPELAAVHPLGKVPAAVIDGEPLFESAAICTFLADSLPEKGLIPPVGSRARALHDQWTAFCLSEIEAHAWSSFRNTVVYPEDQRVPEILEQNTRELKRGLMVLDEALDGRDYLLGDDFAVTDIFVGYEVNNARRRGEFGDDMPNLLAWVQRLLARPACPFETELLAA